MERTEAQYRDLAKQRETERAQRLLAITKQSIENDPIARKLLRSNRWNKVMNAADAPKLQTFIRLSFARGRRYNTATHTIDELGWFAGSLGCKEVTELEHAIVPYLVDERSAVPYKDCDIKAYSMLADFLAYLSDKGFKANSRIHAIATAGKFIRSMGHFYWNKELFRQYCQLPSQEEAEDVDFTRHEIQLLTKYMTFSTKRRFLAMLATGLNPIDLSRVRVKDVHFDEAIPRITIIRTKTNVKFETFITPEAWNEALKHLPHNIPRDERVDIDLKNPEQRIWGINPDPYQESTVWSNHFRRAIKKAAACEPEIARKFYALAGRGKTFSITMRTATRKYFFTQVSKKVGVDFAHCWTGHKLHLGTYLRLSLEEKQELFRQCIPALTMYADVENDKQRLLHDVLLNVELLVEDPTQREAIKKELEQLDPRATKDDIFRKVRQMLKDNQGDALLQWAKAPKATGSEVEGKAPMQEHKKRVFIKEEEIQKYLDQSYMVKVQLKDGSVVMEFEP